MGIQLSLLKSVVVKSNRIRIVYICWRLRPAQSATKNTGSKEFQFTSCLCLSPPPPPPPPPSPSSSSFLYLFIGFAFFHSL